MRLLTFVDPATGALHVGALSRDGRRIVDLTVVGLDDMFEAVGRAASLARLEGHLVEHEGAVGHAADAVRVVAPMPGARGVHLGAVASPASAALPAGRRALAVVDAEPALAFADPAPLLGPGDALTARAGDRWTLCMAAVLGRGGRDVAADDALARIAGYAVAGRWLGGGEDDDAPVVQLGPWLVTPDQAGAPGTPRAGRVLVDGAVAADAAWAVGAPFAHMIARASGRYELRPGDVLTAPLAGVGGAPCAVPVRAGQEVRLEVEGLGALPATVV